MKRMLTVIAVALVIAAMVVVMAAPAFARLTTTQVNGGGNTPNGNANGVPTQTCNSGGNCPPGQNP